MKKLHLLPILLGSIFSIHSNGEFLVESGDFDVFVGGNSKETLKMSFKLED